MTKLPKTLAGYSLLEILITMAIFGVLSVALMQSLLQNIRYSSMITARSQIRSEIDQAMSIIQRDIRNANDIDTTKCNQTPRSYNSGTINCDSSCNLKNNDKDLVIWCFDNDFYEGNGGAVAKWVYSTSSSSWEREFLSSGLLDIEQLIFSKNTFNDITATDYTPYANIMVTLLAQNTDLHITNQVKQISVTTRNYSIK